MECDPRQRLSVGSFSVQGSCSAPSATLEPHTYSFTPLITKPSSPSAIFKDIIFHCSIRLGFFPEIFKKTPLNPSPVNSPSQISPCNLQGALTCRAKGRGETITATCALFPLFSFPFLFFFLPLCVSFQSRLGAAGAAGKGGWLPSSTHGAINHLYAEKQLRGY